jgi:hypothetical protein
MKEIEISGCVSLAKDISFVLKSATKRPAIGLNPFNEFIGIFLKGILKIEQKRLRNRHFFE